MIGESQRYAVLPQSSVSRCRVAVPRAGSARGRRQRRITRSARRNEAAIGPGRAVAVGEPRRVRRPARRRDLARRPPRASGVDGPGLRPQSPQVGRAGMGGRRAAAGADHAGTRILPASDGEGARRSAIRRAPRLGTQRGQSPRESSRCSARHSHSGGDLPSPIWPTSPGPSAKGDASRSCASVRSRIASTPSSSWEPTPSSSPNWRPSWRSSRFGSDGTASSCSRCTGADGRPKPCRRSSRSETCSSKSSASIPAPPCAASSRRSSSRIPRSTERVHPTVPAEPRARHAAAAPGRAHDARRPNARVGKHRCAPRQSGPRHDHRRGRFGQDAARARGRARGRAHVRGRRGVRGPHHNHQPG